MIYVTNPASSTVNQKLDSVYVRDSIFIRERGDTVFVERWHDRWREHTTTQTTVNRASCTVNPQLTVHRAS